MTNPTCTMPGCDKPARSRTAALCPMHYHRDYRHGNVDRTAHASGVSVRKPRRYVARYLPSHPLAMKNGKVWAHRAALFDSMHGADPRCWNCDAPLSWASHRGDADVVHVDHIDGDGANNDLENLRPSCMGCNTGRGTQERSDALRLQGWWSRNDTIGALRTDGRRDRIA